MYEIWLKNIDFAAFIYIWYDKIYSLQQFIYCDVLTYHICNCKYYFHKYVCICNLIETLKTIVMLIAQRTYFDFISKSAFAFL